MLIFEKIRWQNLNATGNAFIEFDFTSHNTTLIMGENGSGKCVRGITEIEVCFPDPEVYSAYTEAFGPPQATNSVVFRTIIRNVVKFYRTHPEFIGRLGVMTRNGVRAIQYADITAYDSEIIRLETESDGFIEGSPDHLVSSAGKWVKLKDLEVGAAIDTVAGQSPAKTITKLPFKEDLYDIQVEGFEYLTQGIVTHNSTLQESLCYVLYGKPYRKINKGQLVNTITKKNLLVEIEFSKGHTKYFVRRGMKPNVFEIHVDGIKRDADATKAGGDQEYLEKHVLGMSYETFVLTQVIGSAKYTPFMDLPAARRREVVESMINLGIFSTMSSLLKTKKDANDKALYDLENKLILVNNQISAIKLHHEEMRKNTDAIVDAKHTKILAHKETITKLKAEGLELNRRVSELKTLIEDNDEVLKRSQELLREKHQVESKIEDLKTQAMFFADHEDCPTCHQSITDDFKQSAIGHYSEQALELRKRMKEILAEYKAIGERQLEINKISEEIYNLGTDISGVNQRIFMTNAAIDDLEAEIKQLTSETKTSTSIGDLDVCLEERRLLEAERKRLQRLKRKIEIVAPQLKDSGAKSKIIGKYIPLINKLINQYLAMFGFMCDFNIDEDFNETIRSRYRDTFTYHSFSEGQKARIDIAILFTWRAIAKMRNTVSTNLLILDETFDGSMDIKGTDDLARILPSLGSMLNLVVISHRNAELYTETFDRTIEVNLVKNFTQFNQIKG